MHVFLNQFLAMTYRPVTAIIAWHKSHASLRYPCITCEYIVTLCSYLYYADLQPDLFEVDLTGTLPQVGVMADNTVAVVGAQRSALTCFTCVHKTHCTHCSVVQQYMSAIIDESKVSLLPNGFLVLRDLLVNVKSDRSGSESHPSSVVKGVSNTPIPHTPSVDEPLHLTEAIPENSRCPECSLQLYSKTDRVYIGRYPMISMIKVLSIKGEHLKYSITAKALNFFLCGHGCVKYRTVYLLL